MKPKIQISAKQLGSLALDAFCPRCFWIRMMCGGRLPYQTFPGIFSSIDSYSKKLTSSHFRQHGRVPKWFESFGDFGSPIRVPGWSKFQMVDPETNVLLTGVPDEILRHPKRGVTILDYKTARHTSTQDELMPMYEVQLNCYALIAERIGFGRVCGLGILYYEPLTELKDLNWESLIQDDRFFLQFSPKLKRVNVEPDIIPPLLNRAREICDNAECPTARPDCRDCCKLETIVRATGIPCFNLKEQLIRSLNLWGTSQHQVAPQSSP